MCFEVILEIFVAFFAVFGLYALLLLIWEWLFDNPQIFVCVLVTDEESAKDVLDLVREAAKHLSAHRKEVLVVVSRQFANEAFLNVLKENQIPYRIACDME